MTLAIRPIQTRYAGHLFRSRLEARWAVFFDTLNVRWRYEPQGFVLTNTGETYLPDFWLPKQRIWFEVKGEDDPRGVDRWKHFSEVVDPAWAEDNPDSIASAVNGVPDYLRGRSFLADEEIPDPRRVADGLAPDDAMFGSGGHHYYWTRCPKCRAIGITWDGRAERLPCRCVDGVTPRAHDPLLLHAYGEARAARFEHADREHW